MGGPRAQHHYAGSALRTKRGRRLAVGICARDVRTVRLGDGVAGLASRTPGSQMSASRVVGAPEVVSALRRQQRPPRAYRAAGPQPVQLPDFRRVFQKLPHKGRRPVWIGHQVASPAGAGQRHVEQPALLGVGIAASVHRRQHYLQQEIILDPAGKAVSAVPQVQDDDAIRLAALGVAGLVEQLQALGPTAVLLEATGGLEVPLASVSETTQWLAF